MQLGLFNFFGTSILCLGGCGGLGIGITGFKESMLLASCENAELLNEKKKISKSFNNIVVLKLLLNYITK